MRYLAFVGLVACGGREERFLTDTVDALCAEASACAGTYEPAACVDALRGGLDAGGCTFDPSAAKDCARALDEGEAACEALEPFQVSALALPEACAAAYDCGRAGGWLDPLTDDLPAPSSEQ